MSEIEGSRAGRIDVETTHNEMQKLKLPADLQRAIERGNAERLIPRLRG
jgi:hypothetical protein